MLLSQSTMKTQKIDQLQNEVRARYSALASRWRSGTDVATHGCPSVLTLCRCLRIRSRRQSSWSCFRKRVDVVWRGTRAACTWIMVARLKAQPSSTTGGMLCFFCNRIASGLFEPVLTAKEYVGLCRKRSSNRHSARNQRKLLAVHSTVIHPEVCEPLTVHKHSAFTLTALPPWPLVMSKLFT